VAVPGWGGSFCSKDSLVGFVIRRATPFLSNIQTPDMASAEREGGREMARDAERDCKMGACSVCDV